MLSYLRYRLLLRKISKHEKKLEARRPTEAREAYESGQMAWYIEESNNLYEWRRLALTRHYREKAERLLIFMPPLDDPEMYDQVEYDKDPDEPRYLTDKGLKMVRDAIREEQKHRREVKAFWLTWVTGLGGVLIGVISVWPKA